MKKIFIILIILSSLLFVSCLEDLDSSKKKSLFIFYDNMKNEILNDNINWILLDEEKDRKELDGKSYTCLYEIKNQTNHLKSLFMF